jgi:pimeloyl-ACP methyl ester carboxylesterase
LVEIAYDRLAGSAGDPLLLVMGLAVSRFWWPAGLGQAFADRGFAVARYDQRDAGQSTRMPEGRGANPFAALVRKRGAYSSEDMTDDAVAVLDALGWERAHVFGASLGGIIAQRIALRHPDRVLSVTSAMAMPSDVSGIGGRHPGRSAPRGTARSSASYTSPSSSCTETETRFCASAPPMRPRKPSTEPA